MLKQLINRVPCMARTYQQSYLAINRLPMIFDQMKTFNLCHLSNSIRLRSDRRYSEKHEWVVMDNNDKELAIVGISQYAQEALGDVVYVQLPEVDAEFNQDDEVGAVESVKAANEIYTPLSGTIAEVNTNLEEKPNLINSSCYEDGWLFKIKIRNQEEVDGLMDESTYEAYIKSMH